MQKGGLNSGFCCLEASVMGGRGLTACCSAVGDWNSGFCCLVAAVIGARMLTASSSAVGEWKASFVVCWQQLWGADC